MGRRVRTNYLDSLRLRWVPRYRPDLPASEALRALERESHGRRDLSPAEADRELAQWAQLRREAWIAWGRTALEPVLANPTWRLALDEEDELLSHAEAPISLGERAFIGLTTCAHRSFAGASRSIVTDGMANSAPTGG